MITILCGRVAAGKTTLAHRICEETGALHLSCDELMLTLFDSCLGQSHDAVAMKCLHYLFSLAAQAAERGVGAVLDYGFWLPEERQAARDYFDSRRLPYRMIEVKSPDPIRLRRLEARNEALRGAQTRVYLIEGELLGRMDAKYHPPTPEEAVLVFDNTAEGIPTLPET